MTFRPRGYHDLRHSGMECLGKVPAHWSMCRLAAVTEMRVSNVDKHSKPGEAPVRLCNYVDVYKNDRVHREMSFMRATASKGEIAKFRLRRGDVLITKDSEDWTDIAVPSLVESTANDLLCGYHVAILRPSARILGGYVLRTLQSPQVKWQFRVAAAGVTRYGLTQHAIRSVRVTVPPLPEQRAIVRFLDHADRRIQRYIRAKERLIELLEEQKQGIIQQAVSGQINVRTGQPYPAYKGSGVEWLGEVPEHWELIPLKRIARRVQNGATPPTSELAYYEAGTVPWYGPSSIMAAEEVGSPVKHLTELAFSEGAARLMRGPSVLVGVIGNVGRMALMSQDGSTNQQITAFELPPTAVSPRFVLRQLRRAEPWLRSSASAATIPILDSGTLARIPCAVPSLVEQQAIDAALDSRVSAIDQVVTKYQRQIGLAHEYRTRLIADVVTGKLDVRGAAATLRHSGFLAARGTVGRAVDRNPEEDEPAPQEARP